MNSQIFPRCAGNILPNGIQLPADWPPKLSFPENYHAHPPMRVPYLESPPPVIPIDGGRQLFVDDFLVEDSAWVRAFHKPVKHPGNPVFFPQTPWERDGKLPACTVSKCGGVWFDEADGLFKMWYMGRYTGPICYATSRDGVRWERPELDVVPGTNIVIPEKIRGDSGTVWIDKETSDSSQRYKFAMREPGGFLPGLLFVSPDGIHWSDPIPTGPVDDRTTMFYNPFRKKWVHSIRSTHRAQHGQWRRARSYWEGDEFLCSGNWKAGEPGFWAIADCLDESKEMPAELYTLDAVAYESLMVGLFQILKGPPNPVGMSSGEPKLTELVFGTSRDGFHWHRPDRSAFLGARREAGSWEFGYVEASGGTLLVVGEELWIYYCAYAGDRENRVEIPEWGPCGMYSNGAVGLAKLRRDGFASMQPRHSGATLTTRPVLFSGDRFFVNAQTSGSLLRVEVLDDERKALPGFSLNDCDGFFGNSTCAEIRWKNHSLGELAGKSVRMRFHMERGELYAFWVTSDATGRSGGYRGAGGHF